MRMWVAAGGTAGHLLAGVAVLEAAPAGTERVLVVSDRELDRRLAEEAPVDAVVVVGGAGLPRDPRRAVGAIARNARAIPENLHALSRPPRPDVVLTLGGFHTPVVAAVARARGARVALLEQNAVLGRANRAVAPFASRIFLAWPLALSPSLAARALVVGNPVGAAVRAGIDRTQARLRLGLGEDETLVVVTSGSLGARAVNEAVAGMVESLVAYHPNLRIWHAMGARNVVPVPSGVAGYEARAFWPQLHEAIAAADLVVGRAGAGTLTEVALAGVASVLVPLPRAPGNHQRKNAAIFERAGAAVVCDEGELTDGELGRIVGALIDDPAERARMGLAARRLANPEAAHAIAEEMMRLWHD